MDHSSSTTIDCTASLSARTPAFVHEPRFVFVRPAPVPTASELLRDRIAAARAARA